MMPPLPSPGFPLQPSSSQPPTPYQQNHDPTPSPSNSTHSNRPPPQQPAYPTLSYSQQNGWMYPPNYYPPQPRYNNQPYYPPYGQMGGPGPATMQNGYGGYQPDGYPPHLRQSSYPQQGYQPPSETYPPTDGEPPKQGVAIDNQPYPQQPPPPPFHDAFRGNSPYPPIPNGPTSPPGPQSQFQNYYPPDHPYAHGGGFGYPQYPSGPGMGYGNGYGGYPSGPPPPQMFPPPQSYGKGLNPAAQGFNFTPSQGRPAMNGDTNRPPPKPEEFPVFASIQSTIDKTPISNGHSEPSQSEPVQQTWAGPVMVDGEKLKGIGGRGSSGDSQDGGSLGLTQMDASAPPPEAVPPAPPPVPDANVMTQSTSTTQSISTPAMSTSPTTPTTPVLVQTPRATTDGEGSMHLSPKSATTSQAQGDGQWNFVGPSMSGYISPPPSATVPSFSQAMSTQPPAPSAAPRRRAKVSADTGPLKLRSSRPEADSTAENAYNSSLSGNIPKTVQTEQIAASGEVPRLSARGKGRASGKKVVFAAGIDDEAMARMGVERREPNGLMFGSLTEGAQDVEEQTLAPPQVVEPTTLVINPPPKPASWAALFGGASKSFSRTSSVPSSMVVSPSKSVISLATESEAGPSRLSTEPTTPRSVAPTLPPSTGASTASASRPVFNYAAAAAAGAKISPQDELARMLSDGLRVRAKEAPMCLPRGLINTGNMCFANTILQVLVYCPPFTELLEELSKRLKADLARRTPLLESMIVFLREFNPSPGSSLAISASSLPNGSTTPKGKARDQRQEAFIPENVYDAVKENKRFDSMRRGFQEDAEEYLGFFINTLHEEMLLLLSRLQPSRAPGTAQPNGDVDRKIERPVSPGADGAGWLEVGKKQRTNVVRSSETRESAVSRLFGGTLRSVLHTPGQKDSVTLEPYQPLQLDIQSPDVHTISDALRHISEPEIVPGVWSSARGTNVDATKQVYIETFPPVLILHLKRFVYDGTEQSVVKRSKLVAYGTELIIPPEIVSPARRAAGAIKYKLFGVVYHHGTSASGGHYTVSVARQDAAGWVHFDDETYAPVPTDAVVVSREEAEEGRAGLISGRERCAYLLFYQRVRA